MIVADYSIHGWISENEIKNEKGEPIEFDNHLFLFDIYADQSQNICVTKPAQVGLSTLQVIKNHFDARNHKLDIIYTLPTDGDVNVFVSGKVNRIIANNPCMLADVADKDSIEQKQIKDSYEYFRGTWTKKAAIMITADRLVHDEIDSSKLSVIADFPARLQHSKHKQIHVFSHPSVPNKGVDSYFKKSDQKEWFVRCPHCKREQILTWDTERPERMSVDFERKIFVCKKCRRHIPNYARALGRWVSRKGRENAKWSGYHISLLMAPWVTAAEIIEKYQEVVDGKQTMDFFYNKVLGLPYAGSGNTVDEETILGLVTQDQNPYDGRLVVGVDTGVQLRYVIGNRHGLLGFGQMKDYMPDDANKLALHETLEYFLIKFPNSIMVLDRNGDIIGSRKLHEKYPGRVFLCDYARDRKTMQLIRWGSKDESGIVHVDRNRTMQMVIGEARERRWLLYNGTRADWHDYWLHWSHIYRVWEEDTLGRPQFVWMRDGRDDWVHATVYWRVGISRFGTSGAVMGVTPDIEPNSYMVSANQTASFNPEDLLRGVSGVIDTDDEDDDWRDSV